MLDSYVREFNSKVNEVREDRFVVLDDTAFYPQGGGQPFDTGVILRGDDKFNVIAVRKQDGVILHEVDRGGLQKQDIILGRIDWDRRYRLMRMHTAAHVVSSVFEQEEHTKITGNQLGIDQSRVDFSMEEFNRDKMQLCIDMANDILSKNLPIEVRFIRMDDAKKDPSLFKLAMEFPHQLEELRLVDIVGRDCQADGGTHVKNTKEVGKIILKDCENKGRDKRRVYFSLEH
jgi:misacylated tRNA(Ala) deacylase